jgi:hypothetical protein
LGKQLNISLATGSENENTAGIGEKTYFHQQMLLGEHIQGLFCPFDNANPSAIKIVVETELNNLFNAVQAIEVDVIKGEPPLILVNDDKRGTGGITFDTQPPSNTLSEAGLPYP